MYSHHAAIVRSAIVVGSEDCLPVRNVIAFPAGCLKNTAKGMSTAAIRQTSARPTKKKATNHKIVIVQSFNLCYNKGYHPSHQGHIFPKGITYERKTASNGAERNSE